MSNARNRLFSLVSLVALASAPVLAQTGGEKAKETLNDGSRKVKKSMHRAGEAICTGTKAECAKRKLQHRVKEGKDTVEDKAGEMKDKVE